MDPVFAKALAKSPDARHDTCLAFVAALRATLDSGAGPADARPAPGPDTETDHEVSGPPSPPHWADPVYRSGATS
ncbi:hypothetical protein [Streptomyces puniciscabiei]|uniref:hypothetical protein n=1 Tax=Streptomyces puniciscabiei TaxID=164348 RepID=UPI0006EB7B37|nr:hypothetical protein [Streptomyces puniciscabiei]